MKPHLTVKSRRSFFNSIAAGAATLGLFSFPKSIQASADVMFEKNDSPDAWTSKLTGKHRVVFDVPQPHELFPFAWPRVFLMTNVATGTPEKENNVVVVLRHNAIPYAFEDRLWMKYKLGEHFKINDAKSKMAVTKNPFWQPEPGSFKVPGIGPVAIGINELQDSGVIFLVCEAAITVNSAVVADKLNLDAATVRADWVSGLLPGIQSVPSGVWALGLAQEKGCGYIFAG